MKSPRNSKFSLFRNQRHIKYYRYRGISYYFKTWYLIISATLVFIVSFVSIVHFFPAKAYAPLGSRFKNGLDTIVGKTFGYSLQKTMSLIGVGKIPASSIKMAHNDVITTVFWVGEKADISNGYISNDASAWDEQWQSHYGGYDDPERRIGYLPATFVPKENPFYVALPYNDLDNFGKRKSSAKFCPNNQLPGLTNYSWCKNSWVAIQHGNKIVFAQWQDVGPYSEDDSGYVFGDSAPLNTSGAKAGLDVSPAVRDYLGLTGIDKCRWSFVAAKDVPDGPWKQIITTYKGRPVSK